MSRTLSNFAAFIGALCVYFIIHLFFSTHVRTVRNDVIQGFLIGYGLAFASAQAYARIKAVKVNGWITMFGLGKPGNGMFLRTAHAQLFPGPVNVPEEAMYWWTNADGAGRTLSAGTTTSCISRRPSFHPTMRSGRSRWVRPGIISCRIRSNGTV